MRYFCTYFDSGYLAKGLALYRSLVRHSTPFRFWVLCFDDLTYKALKSLRLDEVIPISLNNFEAGDEKLLQAKTNRSQIEYYFTCTPSLPLYILRNYPEVDLITYVDADLFFFSDLSPIYEELGNNSILIIGHRFPPHSKSAEVNGVYNVGFLSFRNDDVGIKCLRWWRDRCLEWCYDRLEDGRFADQKYLDDWPARFPQVIVLQNEGVGLAPWNISNYNIHYSNGSVMIDSSPLIMYHFHHLKMVRKYLFDTGLVHYNTNMNKTLSKRIYANYLKELKSVMHKTRCFDMDNIRQKNSPINLKGIIKMLIYNIMLFIAGPINIVVHLKPLIHPLLQLRIIALRRLGLK